MTAIPSVEVLRPAAALPQPDPLLLADVGFAALDVYGDQHITVEDRTRCSAATAATGSPASTNCRCHGESVNHLPERLSRWNRSLRPQTAAAWTSEVLAALSCADQGRRMRDSNPRGREPNTLSKRAP